MTNQEVINNLEAISSHLRPTATDDIASGPILEVQLLDRWFLVDLDTFRSWTGLRRLNGDDFHGDIFYLESSSPYTGARACPCSTCQSSVNPRHRKN